MFADAIKAAGSCPFSRSNTGSTPARRHAASHLDVVLADAEHDAEVRARVGDQFAQSGRFAPVASLLLHLPLVLGLLPGSRCRDGELWLCQVAALDVERDDKPERASVISSPLPRVGEDGRLTVSPWRSTRPSCSACRQALAAAIASCGFERLQRFRHLVGAVPIGVAVLLDDLLPVQTALGRPAGFFLDQPRDLVVALGQNGGRYVARARH